MLTDFIYQMPLKVKKEHNNYYLLFFPTSELQVRRGIEDNSEIFFFFLNENICCDPSLKPYRRDGSNDGSQNMYLWRNMSNYP